MGAFFKWLCAYAFSIAAVYAVLILIALALSFLVWKAPHPNWLALMRLSALVGLPLSALWMIGDSDA